MSSFKDSLEEFGDRIRERKRAEQRRDIIFRVKELKDEQAKKTILDFLSLCTESLDSSVYRVIELYLRSQAGEE
jgi:hypothetical protein